MLSAVRVLLACLALLPLHLIAHWGLLLRLPAAAGMRVCWAQLLLLLAVGQWVAVGCQLWTVVAAAHTPPLLCPHGCACWVTPGWDRMRAPMAAGGVHAAGLDVDAGTGPEGREG